MPLWLEIVRTIISSAYLGYLFRRSLDRLAPGRVGDITLTEGGAMGRVLVVEDEPRLAEALQAALEAAGYQVVVAATLLEARAVLATGTITAVVCDGAFPMKRNGKNCRVEPIVLGVQFCREARAKGARTVLYSGTPELVTLEQRLGYPALLKPAAFSEILAAIEYPVSV